MKKVILTLDAGFAGMTEYETYSVSDELWDIYTGKAKGEDVLGNFAWERAVDHASMYGIYPEGDRSDTEEDDEEGDSYSDSIEGYFEEYNEEEHSGLKSGGGEWTWDEEIV